MRYGGKRKHTVKGLSLNFAPKTKQTSAQPGTAPTASEKGRPPLQKQVLVKTRLAWKLTQNFFCLSFPHSAPAGGNQRGPAPDSGFP